MRPRLLVTLAFVVGCAVQPRPAVSVPAVASPPALPSSVIEPQLPGATCTIAGGVPSLATDALALCGKRDEACFGRLRANDARGARITSLHVDDARSAEIDLARGGLTVHAIVSVAGLALHPAQVELVNGFFVPTAAALRLERVDGPSAKVTFDEGARFVSLSALGTRWSCAQLSVERSAFTLDDVIQGLNLTDSGDDVVPVSGAPLLRDGLGGRIVAKVSPDVVARVVEREPDRLRVVIDVETGFLVGWVEAADFGPAPPAGRRTYPPRLYMGITHVGTKCPHPVRVLARVGTDVVHVATIAANEPFEPADPRSRLEEVFDVGEPPNVAPWIPAAELAGCSTP